ncbi:MAG: response regulator [Planctomycetota bacterium]|jgi:CheY-like chemotaxis protein
MQNLKPILLVEDDRVDAMTFKRTLGELGIKNPVVHSVNGEEALAHLKADGNEEPCFIFLDLNMPRMNGIEFLKIVKADEALKRIPVIVLTTSDNEKDIIESFEFGVAGYMVKPADYKRFVEVIRTINLYWNLSKLPDGGPDNAKYETQNLAGRR